MGARLNGRSHRFGRKAERFEKESARSKRQRRKRSGDSNQAIPTAVPRPLDRSVAPGKAIRMDRANDRNEQQDSVAGQLPAPKYRHVAQCDDRRKRKICDGPAGPGDVQHPYRLDEQPEYGRNPLLRFAVYGGGFHLAPSKWIVLDLVPLQYHAGKVLPVLVWNPHGVDVFPGTIRSSTVMHHPEKKSE